MSFRASITGKFAVLLLAITAGMLAAVGGYYGYLTRNDRVYSDIIQSLSKGCIEVHRRIDNPAPFNNDDRLLLRSLVPVSDQVLSALERGGYVNGVYCAAAPRELSGAVQALRTEWPVARSRLLEAAAAQADEEKSARERLHGVFPRYQAGIDLMKRSLEHRRAALFDHMWSTFGVICAIQGVFLLVGIWCTRRFIVRPILDVEAGARRLAAGDYTYAVPVTTADETGKLAAAFNRMSGELKSSTDALRQSERAIAAKAEELAVKNSELEQYSYAASHDLQEPLRMVIAYAQLLKVRCGDRLKDDGELYLSYIETGAKRMQRLLTDLLSYSRSIHQPGDVKRVDASEALRRAILSCDTAIKESSARISFDAMPIVLADDTGLELVFQNLITNAIKYRGDLAPVIDITAEADGAMCIFRVKDNGMGIRPEYHERIFGLFKRLHGREIPGTGIGLALTRKIVQKSGGNIHVESAEGRGSTFVFTLPMAEPARATAGAA